MHICLLTAQGPTVLLSVSKVQPGAYAQVNAQATIRQQPAPPAGFGETARVGVPANPCGQ
jgi:hypothetical protein